jgi:uncharacterized membrane protein YhaH (DUF805 family)
MFDFNGRARRSEFWWYYLFLSIISFVVTTIFLVIIFASMIPMFTAVDAYGNVDDGAMWAALGGMMVAYALLFIFSIAISVALLGASARRLHDMGQSGHWLWLYLLSLGIVPLIMCIMEGQPYANQWGPDPKAGERARMAGNYAAQPPMAPPPPPPPAAPPVASSDPFASPPSA